jgi:hypothetical protein
LPSFFIPDIMATFGGLFDFPEGMSDDQSELSDPPDSDDQSISTKASKDKDNVWYNIPSGSEEDDDDDITPQPTFTLPIRPAIAVTVTAFIITIPLYKEHSIGARIKAIYMLKEFLGLVFMPSLL